MNITHQFVERRTGRIVDEKIFGDGIISRIFNPLIEDQAAVYHAVTSNRMSRLLSWAAFDSVLGSKMTGSWKFLRGSGIDLGECLDPPQMLDTPRKIFERKIRYWDVRPMPQDASQVLSPADSKMLAGSFKQGPGLFLKEKLFSFEELLGRRHWLKPFSSGDFAVFRLTPDKYHYTHCPVSGIVRDFYEIEGRMNSCNPAVVMRVSKTFSKNKRVVTIIDTDVEGGSGVGLVAMIEIVALMVGNIRQAYSPREYLYPREIVKGMKLERGRPKALFMPGSSTVVLMFEEGRIGFHEDILTNMHRQASSRYSTGFGGSIVETEVAVRSGIADMIKPEGGSGWRKFYSWLF
jgi:phosphatidylserine decarboxylase